MIKIKTFLGLILLLIFNVTCSKDSTLDLSNNAQITGFTIPNQDGDTDINQKNKTITVYFKSGTSLTIATPIITVSKGASYSPIGTLNFTNPVTYTVTAEDGTTKQNYTVTIVFETSNSAIISKFNLSNEIGLIDNNKGIILVSLPFGSSITNLIPEITVSAGATYTPTGTQNFTNPLTYTVTAEDGISKKSYEVTVKKSNEALITSFTVPNQIGATIINSEKKIIVFDMPKSSNVTNLTPSLSISLGATYTPQGNQDFTNPVKYIVTSENGTVINYTVIARVISDSSSTFVSKWTTRANDKTIRLPLIEEGTYAFNVDWGDGTMSQVNSFNKWYTSSEYHTYPNSSTEYTISITGIIEGFNFNSTPVSAEKILDISQWGPLKLGNGGFYFFRCTYLKNISATDVNLAGVTDLSYTFSYCPFFNGDIGYWDVSQVTNMSHMFSSLSGNSFNKNIGAWDVSKVTDMSYMFHTAAFNQDIGDWDVSNVTKMNHMFSSSFTFNQDIGDWDVSKVTTMEHMFSFTRSFNQDIGDWDVSKVTTMENMFIGAWRFNQDLSDWCVTNTYHLNFNYEEIWTLPKPQWGTCPNP